MLVKVLHTVTNIVNYKMKTYHILLLIVPTILSSTILSKAQTKFTDPVIISYTCDEKKQDVQMHWEDVNGKVYGNIGTLLYKLGEKQQDVVLAMNGGMYLEDQSPQGLYIEKGKTIRNTNTKKSSYGNFYMQPNGVFYILDNDVAGVCKTDEISKLRNIKYATQSGPMLVHDGQINAHFKEGSESTYIRNGVGILPDGSILFAISTEKVNLYRFANFFRQNGCKNALYLDGFVSKMYCPELNIQQTDGSFGVIICVIEE